MGICCCKKNKNAEKLLEASEEDINKSFDKNSHLTDSTDLIKSELTELVPNELAKYMKNEIDDKPVFKREWYNDLEKNKIIYSQRTIVAILNEAFDPETEGFKTIHEKDNLVLAIRAKGSYLSEEFQMARSTYTVSKSELPKGTDIKLLAKYFIWTKERKSWDTQLKKYETLEGEEFGVSILQNWMKSPGMFISEKDIVEKRYDFIYDGVYYSFESSIPDGIYPEENNVTRIVDIIGFNSVSEDSDNFYLKSLSQVDIKSKVPPMVLNGLLPTKLKTFYKNGIAAINKDFKEKEAKPLD